MSKQLLLVTIVVFSAALSIPCKAQVPGTTSPRDKSIEDKFRSDEIERVRRESLAPRARHATRFPQIKEDFERIQVINRDVLQKISFEGVLDFQPISEAAAEITRRATRLKSNLFSHSQEHAKEIEPQRREGQDLKTLLMELDKAVISFVHNPIFQNTKVVNPQDSERAEKDLQRIIILSARTRKKVG